MYALFTQKQILSQKSDMLFIAGFKNVLLKNSFPDNAFGICESWH